MRLRLTGVNVSLSVANLQGKILIRICFSVFNRFNFAVGKYV